MPAKTIEEILAIANRDKQRDLLLKQQKAEESKKEPAKSDTPKKEDSPKKIVEHEKKDSASIKQYLQITYVQSSPFSLRVSEATAKMGKSHLCPTPHCIKSAMIDRYAEGKSEIELIDFLNLIDSLLIAFVIPDDVVVNQGFYTQLKPTRSDAETEDNTTRTIMYKEYVQYPEFSIFMDVTQLTDDQQTLLVSVCSKIKYLGKKDSLVSYKCHAIVSELPKKAIKPLFISEPIGMIIPLDDFFHARKSKTEKAFLEDLRIYGGSGKNAKRDYVDYVFPYRVKQSSRRYTHYHVITTQ